MRVCVLCECVCKPEDSLVELVLSIHFHMHMGSGERTLAPDLIHKPLPAESFLQPESLTSWCWELETGSEVTGVHEDQSGPEPRCMLGRQLCQHSMHP